jgi:hypothetical protein
MDTVQRTSRSARSCGVLVWLCLLLPSTARCRTHPTEPLPKHEAGGLQPRLKPPTHLLDTQLTRSPAAAVREPSPGPAPYIGPRTRTPTPHSTSSSRHTSARTRDLLACSFSQSPRLTVHGGGGGPDEVQEAPAAPALGGRVPVLPSRPALAPLRRGRARRGQRRADLLLVGLVLPVLVLVGG